MYGLYTLVTFVPPSHTQALLEALFAAGAGRVGNYDRCAFTVRGEGRFRPLVGSSPFIGSPGTDERVEEDRIELAVSGRFVDASLAALRAAHPYEEPAVYLYRLDDRCLEGSQAR